MCDVIGLHTFFAQKPIEKKVIHSSDVMTPIHINTKYLNTYLIDEKNMFKGNGNSK